MTLGGAWRKRRLPSLEGKWFSHTLGASAWGPTKGRWGPWLVGGPMRITGLWEGCILLMRSPWILTWPQSWVERAIEMETSQTFSMTTLVCPHHPSLRWAECSSTAGLALHIHHEARVATAVEKLSWLWDAKGSSNPTCCLSKVRSSRSRWWHSSQSGRSPQPSPNAHCAPLTPALLPAGVKVSTGRNNSTHWKLPEPAWTWPSGLLLQQRETWPTPLAGSREKREAPASPDSSPSTSNPASTKWQLPARSSEERRDPCSCRSSSPTKEHADYKGYSHIRTPSSMPRANCFTWLHRDREK